MATSDAGASAEPYNDVVRPAILRNPTFRFYAIGGLVLATCVAIARSSLFLRNPDVAAWGITFDLTITIPLLYWFVVVRAGKARPLTIAPVFMIGTIAAMLLLPRGNQQFLAQLRMFAVPVAELVLIGALIRRIAKFERSTSADPYERIAAAARTIAGEGRVAEVIASEITVFYYALFCWRKKPEPRPNAMTFHERIGWPVILGALLLMIAGEGTVMHLLLARWSVKAAWLWTAFDIWAVMWLLGDAHALRLRRTFVSEDAFHLRYGMRWSADIPLSNIESIEPIRQFEKKSDVLKVAMFEDPRWLITLREPVIVRGMAGLRKEIRAIAMLPDDETAIDALSATWARDTRAAHP